MKKKSYLMILLSFLFLYNCNNNKADEENDNSKNLTTLDIGYSRLRISLPVFTAKEEGIFEKYGINANLKMYETAQPLMQALVSGKIDIAGYTALPITYNGMIRSRKDLYFISIMVEDQSHRISYFLKSKGNENITTINDLKGKKIGILPTIAYKAWCEEILRQNGLDPNKDVVVQQIAPQQQPQTLKTGGVDALFTNDPAATTALELGVAELISNDVDCPKYISDPFIFGSFNIDKKWADNNEKLFSSVTKAINEAVEFVNNNPEKAKQHMSKYLPKQFKSHIGKYPNALYWTSEKAEDKDLNVIADKYLELGIIPKKLDLTGLEVD